MTVLTSSRITDKVLRFKAPKGMLYKISSIAFSNALALASMLYVVPYEFEDQITDSVTSPNEALASFDMNIVGANHQITDINLTTKYFGVAKDNVANCDVVVTVYGELVKGTNIQLIMEFFRKGR